MRKEGYFGHHFKETKETMIYCVSVNFLGICMTIPGFVGLHLKLHFMFCWVTFEIALSFYYWEIAKVSSTYEYIGIVTYLHHMMCLCKSDHRS